MKIIRHIRNDVQKGIFLQTIITLTPFFENYYKRRMHMNLKWVWKGNF
jgi:hypothetical protein